MAPRQVLSNFNAELSDYKAQAKKIFKQLHTASPSRSTIETHSSHIFQFVPHHATTRTQCTHCSYIIEDGVCYLALASHSYPQQHAFAYLAEVHREFTVRLISQQCVVKVTLACTCRPSTAPTSTLWRGHMHSSALVSGSVTLMSHHVTCNSDTTIQKIRKNYIDARKTPSNLHKLNDELKDVQARCTRHTRHITHVSIRSAT